MARKPTPATEIVDAPVNTSALALAGAALTAQTQEVLALQAHFGLQDVSPDTLVREIKVWTEHAGKAMFEVGMRLCVLRAACPHGEWTDALEKQIGMSPRTAQRFMSAALKCVGKDGPRENILALSRSKVMELVALDDDALEELETTGRIEQLSLELDAIDCMSTTELKKALREATATVEAKDRIIRTKDNTINKVTEQLERGWQPSAESVATTAEEDKQLDAMRGAVLEAEAGLRRLSLLADELGTSGSNAMQTAVRGNLEYLAQSLASMLETHGVAVDFAEMVTPEWMKQGAAKAAAKAA